MPKVPAVVVFVALAAAGCGVDPPSTTPTALPEHGTPSKVELSATPGIGEHGGTATVTARVLDSYALALPDVDVTFSATAGTFDASTARTNSNGVAASLLTADAGTVKVHAKAAGIDAPEAAVTIQPVNVFVPPPVQPPPPPLPGPTVPPPPPPAQPSYSVAITPPASVVAGTPATLTATVTPIGGAPAATSAVWDCDTSTPATDPGTLTSATCTYATAASYTAKLTVTGPGGSPTATATTTVTVTAAPVPSYTVTLAAAPVTISAGNSTTLTATVARVNSAPPPNSWTWDCGTSTPPTNPNGVINTSCTYPTAGIFVAKVTVSGPGVAAASATVDVNVTSASNPLVVAITPTPVTPVGSPTKTLANIHVGDSVDFVAEVTSVSLPASLNWEWDDDNNGTFETLPKSLPTPTQTRRVAMTVAGTWKFLVRVTDPATGRTTSATSQVTVLP